MIKHSCKCIKLGGFWGQWVTGDTLGSCPHPAPSHSLSGHPQTPKPQPFVGPCLAPGCFSLPGGGSRRTHLLRHLSRAGHCCVQSVPAPQAPSITSAACATGRAELLVQAGTAPSRCGCGAGCSRPAPCPVRHTGSGACQSNSAFSPGNQFNQWVRTGAQPCSGTGSEATVSPGEEGSGRTCQVLVHSGLCREQLLQHGVGHQDMDPQAGKESLHALGIVVGVGLVLLVLVLFGYAFVRWYQRGWCWHRPDFVFNLYHTCGLGAVAVELVPPFSISGSLSPVGSSYIPFHNQEP
ncbi:small integral membrane protein 35 [Heliangelus exortis]|uniref:small integral membrane protein 35 n=1 Tax=Heliangelus exortis TaxID=472823 RepID=UPI003A8D510E